MQELPLFTVVDGRERARIEATRCPECGFVNGHHGVNVHDTPSGWLPCSRRNAARAEVTDAD